MEKAAKFTNKGSTVEIEVYDVIGEDPWFGGGISAKQFRADLKEKASKATLIQLRLNSPGGSVTEGAAMLTALDEHPARIEASVDGLAASAASVLAMAADRITIGSNALLMIHNPYAGILGDAEELRHTAGILDKIQTQIVDAYMRHATVSKRQISDWMKAETWFTGQEAVDAGLAHEVTGQVSLAACAGIDPAKFGWRKMPKLSYRPEDCAADAERRRIAAEWRFSD